MQNDLPGHDTAVNSRFASIGFGALHDTPLNASALPPVSTATQNVRELHETKSEPPTPAIGGLHEVPLNTTAPDRPKDMQKATEAHDVLPP
jgi:hypothetical protein